MGRGAVHVNSRTRSCRRCMLTSLAQRLRPRRVGSTRRAAGAPCATAVGSAHSERAPRQRPLPSIRAAVRAAPARRGRRALRIWAPGHPMPPHRPAHARPVARPDGRIRNSSDRHRHLWPCGPTHARARSSKRRRRAASSAASSAASATVLPARRGAGGRRRRAPSLHGTTPGASMRDGAQRRAQCRQGERRANQRGQIQPAHGARAPAVLSASCQPGARGAQSHAAARVRAVQAQRAHAPFVLPPTQFQTSLPHGSALAMRTHLPPRQQARQHRARRAKRAARTRRW